MICIYGLKSEPYLGGIFFFLKKEEREENTEDLE